MASHSGNSTLEYFDVGVDVLFTSKKLPLKFSIDCNMESLQSGNSSKITESVELLRLNKFVVVKSHFVTGVPLISTYFGSIGFCNSKNNRVGVLGGS